MLLEHLTDPASAHINDMPTNGYYASTPTVLVPSAGPAQNGIDNAHAANGYHHADGYFDRTPSESAGTMTPSIGALAGRKRTRDDDHAIDDNDSMAADGSVSTAGLDGISRPVDETAMDAEQNGIPIASNAINPGCTVATTERPHMTSRKSQRMHASDGGEDDLAQLLLPSQMRDVTTEPLIDEATRLLGISWTRMDSREALLINQAAYSKWIQRHYPSLRDVSIWFENSALPAYLVSTANAYSGQQEFYIFSHDLTEGRLVTTDPAQLIPRLRLLPALHLAAPGGHIRAQSNVSASSGEVVNSEEPVTADGSSPPVNELPPPVGICAAHSMEMD